MDKAHIKVDPCFLYITLIQNTVYSKLILHDLLKVASSIDRTALAEKNCFLTMMATKKHDRFQGGPQNQHYARYFSMIGRLLKHDRQVS